LKIGDSDDLALGGNVFFADLQHQDFPFIVTQGMVEPREHLAAARCVKGAAEDAVLNMVEAVVLAHVRNLEPDAVAGDVVDDEGEQLLSAHFVELVCVRHCFEGFEVDTLSDDIRTGLLFG
jgi:hypothetical protein